MQVLIIADDLTGALDSTVPLARIGFRCRVARRPEDLQEVVAAEPDVLAVSTASRDASETEAGRAVDRVLENLGPRIFFKKIDSRLKGNIRAELGALVNRTGLTRVLIAPAIPAQGRFVEHGRLLGAGVSAPIDIAGAVNGSGLDLAIPDVRSDADLDRVVEAVLAGPPALFVGAAGLAGALARHLRPDRQDPLIDELPGPILIAIGSRDPITLAQVEAVRAREDMPVVPAPGGIVARSGTGSGSLLVQLADGAEDLAPQIAGARFARSVADILKNGSFATLLACGGETVDAILGEIGVGCIRVEGEVLPGVPVSSMMAQQPLRLVTKSGGFGPPETLLLVKERVCHCPQDHLR